MNSPCPAVWQSQLHRVGGGRYGCAVRGGLLALALPCSQSTDRALPSHQSWLTHIHISDKEYLVSRANPARCH